MLTKSGLVETQMGNQVFVGSATRKQARKASNRAVDGLGCELPLNPSPNVRPASAAKSERPVSILDIMRERVETAMRTIMLLNGEWPQEYGSSMPAPLREFMEAYGREDARPVRLRPSPKRISEAEALIPLLYRLDKPERTAVVMRGLGKPWRAIGLELACDWRKAKKLEMRGLAALVTEG